VVGRSAAGANVSAVLGGEPALSTQPSHGGKAYDFRWLPENVAYIAILKMDDVEGFESFSAEAFAEIDKKRARGLVVDLRFDDGGNTDVGDLLLARITEKSYRMVSEKHWLVSERYRAVARRHYDGTSAYFSARPGTLLRFRMDAQPPLERSPRYRGPVCFLVGPGTTSSGMMLANAVEDYELATLIGEPTASPPNYFGETLHFSLSKTKLEGIASVARFVRANGDASSVAPVRPDIAVEPTLEEWLRGDDPVLKRALDWIRIGR
jgi:C-terminal processing protease CtpA/Prc